jgi:hypothetical protein
MTSSFQGVYVLGFTNVFGLALSTDSIIPLHGNVN